MSRRLRPALALLGAVLLAAQPVAAQDAADGTIVMAAPIERFMGQLPGGRVGGLIWRGGLSLSSDNPDFGGLSGIGFLDDEGRLVIVSDRGNFVTGQLLYDDQNRPLSLIGVELNALRNSSGNVLPRTFARDAEGLAIVYRDDAPAAVRVAFENLTRVADFALDGFIPGGAAREVAIPGWISDIRTNESLESICIAPPASPIAGSTLLILESVLDQNGNHSAWLLGNQDRGPLSLVANPGVNPTDCAFLPNGDLLVLERGVAFLAFAMKLRRIPAAEVRADNVMAGEILLEVTGGDIDNMEGVAVHTAPDGETRITLLSDNNFNDWERNLILEFALPQ